jgi:hypothetical protein
LIAYEICDEHLYSADYFPFELQVMSNRECDMFYRENGQFKTSYRADQQIFPIAQDRWAVLLLIAAAFLVVPLLAANTCSAPF